jgi:hypothetical protein
VDEVIVGEGLCAIASLGVVITMHRGAGIFSDRYANQAVVGQYSGDRDLVVVLLAICEVAHAMYVKWK